MSHQRILVGALSWNLFHGRDHPPDPALFTWRSRLLRHTERGITHAQVNQFLRLEFATLLAGLDWDVALLQEAPPRWLEPLSDRCGAHGALALTARNALPGVRGWLADRNPDLIASNEGGSNMVLARGGWRPSAIERVVLTTRPERRRLLLVRLERSGGGRARRMAVACAHLSVPSTGRGAAELMCAAGHAVAFAGPDPLLLGGDLNLRPARAAAAFEAVDERHGLANSTSARSLDHLLVRGLETIEPPRTLAAERREIPGPGGLAVRLSDHAPVAASFGVR